MTDPYGQVMSCQVDFLVMNVVALKKWSHRTMVQHTSSNNSGKSARGGEWDTNNKYSSHITGKNKYSGKTDNSPDSSHLLCSTSAYFCYSSLAVSKKLLLKVFHSHNYDD